jgi:hypothetical protein
MSTPLTPPEPSASADSPWARPATDDPRPLVTVPARGPDPRDGTAPILASAARSGRPGAAPLTPSGGFGSGAVTGTLAPPIRSTPRVPEKPPLDAAARRRRTMRWFGGATGGVLAIGVVVILSMVLTGRSPFQPKQSAAPDTRPILAKLCPPPSGAAAPPGTTAPGPSGPRTVDADSGISYRAYGAPWQTWDKAWETGGELGVVFRTGQFFQTEDFEGGYYATILSGSVPAATNDALTLDLKCAGKQVAADVRAAYYPTPNTMEPIKDSATTIGGRPAWVSEFRMHFHVSGLRATSEMVAVALIDVGRPNASILYVSIPSTHDQYDYVINELLASVRPVS